MPDYNGTVQIGRHVIRLTDVTVRERRSSWLARWIGRAEKVTLTNGRTIYLNAAESAQLEEKIQFHNTVIDTYAMARGLGLRG